MKYLNESSLDEGFMDHLKKLTKLGEMGSKAKAIFTALASFKDGDATESTMALIELMPQSDDAKSFKGKITKFIEENQEVISKIKSSDDVEKVIEAIGPEKIKEFSESKEGSWLKDFKAFVIKNEEKFQQILQVITNGDLGDFEELSGFEVPSMVRTKAEQLLKNVSEKAGEQADKISGFLDMVAELPVSSEEVKTESRNLFNALSDSVLNESLKNLAETCSKIGNGYIEVDIPLNDYPENHTSEDGRMLDYGSKKSDSHEGRMTKAKLFRLAQMAQSLHDRMQDGDDLPEWVQDKITTSEDRISSAYKYIDYKIRRINEGAGLAEILFESVLDSVRELKLVPVDPDPAKIEGGKIYIYKPLARHRTLVYPAASLEDVFPTYGDDYINARRSIAAADATVTQKKAPLSDSFFENSLRKKKTTVEKTLEGFDAATNSSSRLALLDAMLNAGVFDIHKGTVRTGAPATGKRFDANYAKSVPYTPDKLTNVAIKVDDDDFLLTIGNQTFVKGRLFRQTVRKPQSLAREGIDYNDRYYVKLETLYTKAELTPGSVAPPNEIEAAKALHGTFTPAQKNTINRLLRVDQPFVTWAKVYDDIYSNSRVQPVFRTTNKSPVSLDASSNWGTYFKVKEGDGGAGELLAAALFPNIIAIGQAGAEAGVDLYDAVNDKKYEVKEPNFRSGTKGRSAAKTIIFNVQSAYKDLIAGLETVADNLKSELTVSYITTGPKALDPGSSKAEKVEYMRKIFGYTGNNNSSLRTVIEDAFDEAYSGQVFSIDATQPNLSMQERKQAIDDAIDLLYTDTIEDLRKEIDFAERGELPVSRVNVLRTIFQKLTPITFFNSKERSPLKTNPIFDGVFSRTSIDITRLNENIRQQYMAAVDPRIGFSGVEGIMIVTDEGYRMFSQQTLKDMVEETYDKVFSKEQRAERVTATGNITQGLLGMDIKNWKKSRS